MRDSHPRRRVRDVSEAKRVIVRDRDTFVALAAMCGATCSTREVPRGGDTLDRIFGSGERIGLEYRPDPSPPLPTSERDEIALRFAVATLTTLDGKGDASAVTEILAAWASSAYVVADAFFAERNRQREAARGGEGK